MAIRNVMNYGAVADDTLGGGGSPTDNNAAFVAATAALQAGDILYIPAGVYRTTCNPCPFRIAKNGSVDIEVMGDGIGETVIQYTSIPGTGTGEYWHGSLFSVESDVYTEFFDGFYFHDMTLWDFNTTFATDYVAALWNRYVKNLQVRNIEIINPKGGAIACYGGYSSDDLANGDNLIENTWVHTVGDTGISNTSGLIAGGFKNMVIRNNRWEGRLVRGGFESGRHEDLTVEGNVGMFRDVADLISVPPQQSGLYAMNVKNAFIHNNLIRLDQDGASGIYFAADAQDKPSATNAYVHKNKVMVRDVLTMYPFVLQGNTFGAGAGGEDITVANNHFQGVWGVYLQNILPDGVLRFENNIFDFGNQTAGWAEVIQGAAGGGNGLAFQTKTRLHIRGNTFTGLRRPTYTVPGAAPVRWAVWPNAVTNAASVFIEDNHWDANHPYASYGTGYGGNVSYPAPEGIYPAESYGTYTVGNITAGSTTSPISMTMLGVLSTDTIKCRPDKPLPSGITFVYVVSTGSFTWALKNNTGSTVNVPANNYIFHVHRAARW